jgi:hypothetical protein
MSYKERLSQMNSDWVAAEAPKTDYSPLPDGRYVVTIDEARIEESDDGRLSLNLGLKVVEGNHTNRLIFKRNNLDDSSRFGYLKADFDKIGLELLNISDLEDFLPNLLDRVIEVRLKTGKPNNQGKTYQNCYIQKFVAMLKDYDNQADGINLDDLTF